MPRGGSRPGERRGGRQKGTPNRRTLRTREDLWTYIEQASTPAQDAHPFRRLVQRMLTTDDESVEVACAKELADRLMPKLKAVEVSTNIDNLQQALALLRALPDAELARMEHPDGQPLGLPHETA